VTTFDSLGVLFFSSSSDTSDCCLLFSAVHCVFPLALLAISLSPLSHFPDLCSLLLALLSPTCQSTLLPPFLYFIFLLIFSFLRVFCWSRFKKLFFPQDTPGA
jgi:apolipoprotein N-acyltransferase